MSSRFHKLLSNSYYAADESRQQSHILLLLQLQPHTAVYRLDRTPTRHSRPLRRIEYPPVPVPIHLRMRCRNDHRLTRPRKPHLSCKLLEVLRTLDLRAREPHQICCLLSRLPLISAPTPSHRLTCWGSVCLLPQHQSTLRRASPPVLVLRSTCSSRSLWGITRMVRVV